MDRIHGEGGPPAEPVLAYEAVEVCFNGQAVLRDVDFSLGAGEILGIVGESGSGKSTLLRAGLGLLGRDGLVTKGDIRFRGTELTRLPERSLRAIRGAGIGMIFQDAGAALCPIRTIGDQIVESLSAHMDISGAQAREKTLALLERLGFRDGQRVWESYPFELSGGMNQRVGIAMAMLLEPPVLLADEPTSALDAAARKQVIGQLKQARALFGTAIVLVTHDIGVVSAMADNILVLKDGRAVEYGPADQVLGRPRDAYTRRLLSAVPRLRRT